MKTVPSLIFSRWLAGIGGSGIDAFIAQRLIHGDFLLSMLAPTATPKYRPNIHSLRRKWYEYQQITPVQVKKAMAWVHLLSEWRP
ncbi:hypothetical protein JZM24_11645 [Candidatus Sodalis endolongispinus]|uniref:Uncharacterized protein n=1 Tax=Candidatus Sodalis endolongispinus TaxID=2812662 RepID=A0ABS5YCC6_9GAMM|nr:hypothetical protein [Candidatus Sodalis endolongispinus]MBT9432613.1 hypothetical protein [Candidatus Sodalis endolongispinus]